MNESIKRHAPTAVMTAAAVLIIHILQPPPLAVPSVTPATGNGAVDGASATPSTPGAPTRLVSCGDSTRAQIAGDDRRGTVMLGPGAHGACTVLFTQQVEGKNCTIAGGRIAKLTSTDLVVTGAADRFTFACEIAR